MGRGCDMVRVRKTCYAQACSTAAYAKGLCSRHYQKLRKYGDANQSVGLAGNNNGRWQGGKSTHPLYLIYHDMRRRCLNPKHARYEDYGGRGISVHPEWLNDFWAFVKDVGERPEGKTQGGRAYWQLDRIDNNGNYEPGNVRWASPSEQASNTRPKKQKIFCKRGHLRSGENLYVNPRTGATKCRTCSRLYDSQRQSRRKGQNE